MKRFFVVGMVLMALTLFLASAAMATSVLKQLSGLNYIDETLIEEGYPLFYHSGYDGGSMIMMDMYGNLVHHWHTNDVNYNIQAYPVPLVTADGNCILEADSTTGVTNSAVAESFCIMAGDYDAIVELDWNSNLVHSTEDALFAINYAAHHDLRKTFNKALDDYTYMALGAQAYQAADAVALGADVQFEESYQQWSPDNILEVDQDGNLVWRWSFADHIVQNYDATKVGAFTDTYGYPNPGAVFGEATDNPGKLNINQVNDNNKGPSHDWNHCNSFDYNPALGHIVINAKDFSEIFIVDHDGTFVSTENFEENWAAAQSSDGDFLYRFGNPHNYGQGEHGGYNDAGDHQFFGAHNVQWIGESSSSMYMGFSEFGEIPGEGHLLIFDNNCWDPTEHASNILEWNPYIMDADGNVAADYVNPPEAGKHSGNIAGVTFFGSTTTSVAGYNSQAVWRFNGGTGFYAYHISGCQRQPSGNTFVCEGTQAHLFEVTASGGVAWEYFTPNPGGFFSAGPVYSGGNNFRSNKLPAGHPALAGKTLVPQGNFRTIVLEGDTPTAANELAKFLGTM